jgi:hypothetical protein
MDTHATKEVHMSRALRSVRGRRAAASGAATLVAGGLLMVMAGAASAVTHVHAKYKVTGSTFIKVPNFTLPLGPGTLAADLNPANGNLKATLTLPDATGSFLQFGVVPVTATTRFVNDGPTTGKLNLNTGAVTTTSKITLRIVSLSVAGVNVPVGDSCQTSSPVVVTVKSQKGFNVLKGGNLAGSYTIGQFQDCGLATLLINTTIPGSGNTVKFTLGKAKLG